jgi:hypothetical protein
MRKELRRSLRLTELQLAYARAKSHMPSVDVPSRLRLVYERFASFQVSPRWGSREDLTHFWTDIRRRLRQGRIEALVRVDRILMNAVRELRLAAGFLTALITHGRTDLPRQAPGQS